MKPRITTVEANEKYKLFTRFEDGTEGILDLSHLAGKGVFKAWDDEDHFFRVFIDSASGAVTWPDEIDIDTYNLYCKLKGISPDEFFKQKEVHAQDL